MTNGTSTNGNDEEEDESDPDGSTVSLYESAVPNPTLDALQLTNRDSQSNKLEVETNDMQDFLRQQHGYLEVFKQQNDRAKGDASRTKDTKRTDDDDATRKSGEGRVNEHIGPVQFNMGGIQVDADDMVRRLKVRCPSPSTLASLLTPCFLGSAEYRIVS
jgi:dynein light intermediate chain 1